jgi:3-isopropylmalate dehydrogenase
MSLEIVTLPGDGSGPEIMGLALEVIRAVEPDIGFHEYLFGGASIDDSGEPLTDETLAACQAADAVLLAAVGGPKWDTTDPSKPRPEQGLLALREGLGLYANLRPIKPLPALYQASPLREEYIKDTDLLIVRELTGGIYFGERGQNGDTTFDRCEYSREEVERIARVAFQKARLKVTLVEYPDIPLTPDRLATAKLWRNTVNDIHNREFPDIPMERMSIKKAVKQMGFAPSEFDTILIENMLGDILSDQAAMITGSLGMLPSISIGDKGKRKPSLSEPGHGSTPDIAGKGIVNPLGMFNSAALMLRDLKRLEAAEALETAVGGAIFDGLRTTDLGGKATTREAADAVLAKLP